MVFIKKGGSGQPEDLPVFQMVGKRLRKGEVGIEVEVEGRNIPREGPDPWVYHQDGSLRGADNGEFVLNAPIAFDAVPKAVDGLFAHFKTNKTVLDQSIRTSVHIHLNVLPFYMNRLTALMALYVTFEEVLTAWCGEHRVGNLFCLRAKDAPNIITTIRGYIASKGMTNIRENHHYAGMNANAIFKFGSLEFRPLRGVTDPATLKTWVEILQKLYVASDNYKDPRELVEQFSMQGPREFFHNVLGEHGGPILDALAWTDDDLRNSLYEGIRMAQDLCYARDWSDFKPVKKVDDPFGRKTTKTAGGRQDAEAMQAPRPLRFAQPEETFEQRVERHRRQEEMLRMARLQRPVGENPDAEQPVRRTRTRAVPLNWDVAPPAPPPPAPVDFDWGEPEAIL